MGHLAEGGAGVIAVSRRPLPPAPNVRHVRVSSYADLPEFEQAILVHLAERADVTAANAVGRRHVQETIAQTQALLRRPWARLVYASSAQVYVDTSAAAKTAASPVSASNAYAESKLAVEKLVLAHGGVVGRLSNVYSAVPTPGTVFAEILAQIPGAGPLVVRDKTPVRDFIWIDDAAYGLAALAGGKGVGVYNIASGIGYSIENVARCALSVAGETKREIRATSAPGRPSWLVLDISDTITEFGWRPTVSLQEGLRRMLQP